ncbi:MAG TPA: phage tail tape measure protein, partial [Rhodopila sp.]|nr:phage tail tape measure protein [Rhodopila sp.]
MASDNDVVQLLVELGDSNNKVAEFEKRLKGVIESLRTINPLLETLGEGGSDELGKLLSTASRLSRALNLFPSELQKVTGELAKTSREAKAFASAVKELELKQAGSPRALAAATRSNDPAKLLAAQAVTQRQLNQNRLAIEALNRETATAQGNEAKALQRQLTQKNKELDASNKRLAEVTRRLEIISREDAIQRGVQSRQRSVAVGERFTRTPEGRAIQAERQAREQEQELAATFRTMNAVRVRSILRANREQQRQEREDRALEVGDAGTENRQRDQGAQIVGRARTRYFLGQRVDAAANTRAYNQLVLRTLTGQNASRIREEAQERAIEVADASALDRQRTTDIRSLNQLRVRSFLGQRQASERAANQERAIEVADASALDRQRTADIRAINALRVRTLRQQRRADDAFQGTYSRAETEDFARQSTSIAARKLSGLNKQLEVANQLLNNPEYVALQQQLAEAQTRLRDIKNPPAPKISEAERISSRRSFKHRLLFGDGGAHLFETQAAIQANFLALNAVYTGLHAAVTTPVEFEKAMQEVKAVTNSTTESMNNMRQAVINTARNSTFSIKELSDATLELAKSGLTLNEIQSTLHNASSLAIATGGHLKDAIELQTSASETFRTTPGESGIITDQLFYTLNSSRLNVEKLNTAMQGVAVTAKEAGLSFAETTSALAALSNAGLTSGQQLNQGFRQAIVALEEPNAKFTKKLQELGLSLADIDPRVNGLIGAFENLKGAGFTEADALQTLGSRAATAFAALLNNTQALRSQYDATLNATGALDAQKVAMTSLADQLAILRNSLETIAVQSSGHTLGALRLLTEGVAFGVQGVSQFGTAWNVLGTILSGVAIARGGQMLLRLISNLEISKNAAAAAKAAFTGMAAAEEGAAAVTVTLRAALGTLAVTLGPGLGIAALIGILGYFATAEDTASKKTEELKTAANEAKTALDEKQRTLETLNEFLSNTSQRSDLLRRNTDALNETVLEARNRFGNLSETLDGNITSFGQLIDKLVLFRQELRDATNVDLQNFIAKTTQVRDDATSRLNQATNGSSLSALARALGITGSPNPATGALDPPSQGEIISTIGTRYAPTSAVGRVAALAQGQGVSKGNIGAALAAINQEQIPTDVRAVLLDIVRNINAPLSEQGGAQSSLDQAARSAQINAFAGRADVVSLSQNLVHAQSLLPQTKALGQIQGGASRSQAFSNITDAVSPDIAAFTKLKDSLSPANRELFLSTDVGKGFDTLTKNLDQVKQHVKDYVDKEAVAAAELELRSIDLQLRTAEKQLSNAKTAPERSAAADHVKQLASRQEELNRALVLARVKAKQDQNNGYGLGQLETDVGFASAHETYQQAMERIKGAQNKSLFHKDPNRPLPPTPPDYPIVNRDSFGAITSEVSSGVTASERDIKIQRAYLSGVAHTGEASKG